MSSHPGRCELNSHAETCAFDNSCRVLPTYPHTLTKVTGFHFSIQKTQNVKVAKVAVAYDIELIHNYL